MIVYNVYRYVSSHNQTNPIGPFQKEKSLNVEEAKQKIRKWAAEKPPVATREGIREMTMMDLSEVYAGPPRWKMVLLIQPGVRITRELVRDRYRTIARVVHTNGEIGTGNEKLMKQLVWARDEAMKHVVD